ncbi:hypothetical protein E1B28_000787 [Marasmius oreades]|uniref:Uncharacterized protein n=1 Tax=Marasmius oreades TaxID=181124 RepID=A0A9P7V286_9AGAR|nr:uncharacterized protein E1B28_000787 [Marasmius oreades]KAG7098887.1 hypothetical protein E1B28_000787 [Marasmius oreades]
MVNTLDSGATYSPQDRDLADQHEDGDEEQLWRQSSQSKGKQREDSIPSDDEEHTITYPPGKDGASEIRRIEETLRRWEVAERLRRKAARDSYTGNRSSIVSQVAGSLWRGSGHFRRHSLGGNHAALHSRDSMDHLPMDSLAPSPAVSPRTSPPLGSGSINILDNPFIHPSESLSHLADSHQVTAVMIPTTPPENAPADGESTLSDCATLTASESFVKPPRPLGLPPPRTPPPIEAPPPPVPQPTLHPDHIQRSHRDSGQRWWHDWLCGCSEGPDRGGDYQAGRTNPNE